MEHKKTAWVFLALTVLWSAGCTEPPVSPWRPEAPRGRTAEGMPGVSSAAVRPAAVHRVVRVRDGDSLTLLSDEVEHEVRLVGIDAPELRQEFGSEAKSGLAALVQGREITFTDAGQDAYHRNLVRLYADGVDVNLEMVRRGLAWHYRAYSVDAGLAAVEHEAKRSGRGLWSRTHPVPPWDWRRMR